MSKEFNMTTFENACLVADCDRPRLAPFDVCAHHKKGLPEGATETLLEFDQPGYIRITIMPPGVSQVIHLEEAFGKLTPNVYDQGLIMEWEKVLARMADQCRQKLRASTGLSGTPISQWTASVNDVGRTVQENTEDLQQQTGVDVSKDPTPQQ